MSNLLKRLLITVSLLGLATPAFAAEELVTLVEVPKPPAVTVLKAEKREIIERRSVTGSVMPREEVSVGTDVSGLLVLELNADIGDVVKEGDILARLDKSALETQLAQFIAQEAQNAASRSQAEAPNPPNGPLSWLRTNPPISSTKPSPGSVKILLALNPNREYENRLPFPMGTPRPLPVVVTVPWVVPLR